MRKLCILIVGGLFLSVQAFGQNNLKKVRGSGIHPSDQVFVNEDGEYFARGFYITFEKHVTEDIYQAKGIHMSNIRSEFSPLKNIFAELESNHGLQQMERLYPEAIPNDTIRYNKMGKAVAVHDHSKRYKLIFKNIKSLKSIKKYFDIPNVRHLGLPPIFYTTSNYPNDPYFDNQWTHKIIESEKVFHITKGDPNIVIGISDAWTTNSSAGVHEDMIGRVIAYEHGKWVPGQISGASHGPRIALIAAATNNNNKGIASLGGKMKIVTSGKSTVGIGLVPGLAFMVNLSASQRPDVLNMSWNGRNDPNTKDDLQDLLDLGVILVAGAGNSGIPPRITYPSGYTFANGEQVISVTATQLTSDRGQFSDTVPLDPPFDPFQYEERFVFEFYGTPDSSFFNYSLDNDPINNPDSSFTDVAAPSARMYRAKGEKSTNDYHLTWGATSEAAPVVTSVVGMMLSVNPELGVREVYDILTSSTDYDNIVVPPNSVTFNHPDGIRKYNKYIGYGRESHYF